MNVTGAVMVQLEQRRRRNQDNEEVEEDVRSGVEVESDRFSAGSSDVSSFLSEVEREGAEVDNEADDENSDRPDEVVHQVVGLGEEEGPARATRGEPVVFSNGYCTRTRDPRNRMPEYFSFHVGMSSQRSAATKRIKQLP